MKSEMFVTTYFIGLLFAFTVVPAHARQGAPSMAGMGEAIQKRQADEMKKNYGFSDAQVKQYFQKEAKINAATQTQLAILRKKLVATKDKDAKRQIANKMHGMLASNDKKVHEALLSVATPNQRLRMPSQP